MITLPPDPWALLRERVEIDEITIPTKDGPACVCCWAIWEYDGDNPLVGSGTAWHDPDCWVLRVRAAIAAADQPGMPPPSPAVCPVCGLALGDAGALKTHLVRDEQPEGATDAQGF